MVSRAAWAFAAATLAACGSPAAPTPDLAAAAAADAPDAPDATSVSAESLYSGATWVFQCPDAPIAVPTPGRNEIVLVDAGPHRVSREKLFNVPFKVKGKLCPTERLNRDAIFVVDVSGSMAISDPEVPDPADATQKTCGRLESYKAIMAAFPAGITNFGVVTFDDGMERSSSRLFATQAELEDDLTYHGAFKLLDIFCDAIGGTEYKPALTKAADLFQHTPNARQYATKEVYFLTDGEPTDTSAARSYAQNLRTTGIPINGQYKPLTIAAIMLNTSTTTPSAYLRDDIASKDTSGQPMYATAATAGDLAHILDGMTDNHLDISTLTHGATAAPAPTRIDLMPLIDPTTLEWQLPPFDINIDLASSAYHMTFEYCDNHRNCFTMIGKLDWTDR
jgi:hypothetical protein